MVSLTAIDTLVRLHKTPLPTRNQRLTHHQFIYNGTVLSIDMSTTPRPPISNPPGASKSFFSNQYHLPRFAKG